MSLTVYKDNKIISAGYTLTLAEQRLILGCIGKIRSEEAMDYLQGVYDPNMQNNFIEINVSEYSMLYDISLNQAYRDMKSVAEKLFNREITIDASSLNKDLKQQYMIKESSSIKTRWISFIVFNEEEHTLSVSFSEIIIPFLSQLRREFTKYKLEHVSNMTSIYAVRIYELLAKHQFKSKKQLSISLVDLKEMLQIENKYPLFANFNKKVIQVAVNQINEHSNISLVMPNFIKKGKKVVGLEFNFDFKEGSSPSRQGQHKSRPKVASKKTKEDVKKMLRGAL